MQAFASAEQSNLYNLDNLYQKDTHTHREACRGWVLYRGRLSRLGGCLGQGVGDD